MRRWGDSYWVDETDFRIRLVVTGKPAVLKNSKVIARTGKPCPLCKQRPYATLVSNKRVTAWFKRAARELPSQWPFNRAIPKAIKVNAAIVTYAHDRRERDLDNSYGCPQDALQAAGDWCGILEKDSQIAGHDGSRLDYDKDNPRVEITISPFREREDQ